MLIQPKFSAEVNPVLKMLALLGGGIETELKTLRPGVYQADHFSGFQELDREWMLGAHGDSFQAEYPALGEITIFPATKDMRERRFGSFGAYGVCDNYEQILEACPEIVNDPKRAFVIFVCEVRKDECLPQGGWRWHKWGSYIGTHEITCEYLHDEPVVEAVFCYHVYEVLNPASIPG